MIRVVLLSLASFIVFVGFAMTFFMTAPIAKWVGALVIAIGCVAIVLVERWTKSHLAEDTKWNRLMKAEGEDLMGGDHPYPDRDK